MARVKPGYSQFALLQWPGGNMEYGGPHRFYSATLFSSSADSHCSGTGAGLPDAPIERRGWSGSGSYQSWAWAGLVVAGNRTSGLDIDDSQLSPYVEMVQYLTLVRFTSALDGSAVYFDDH